MLIYIDDVINHNKPLVNVDLITYIDADSCVIRLSDGMKIKTNDRSISAILRCFEKHMESEDNNAEVN